MSRAVNYALIAVALIFGLTVAWAVTSIPGEKESAAEAPPKVITYSGNTLREEQNGRLVWEITAAESSLDIATQQTTLKDAVGTFYRETGEQVHVKAPAGLYDPPRKRIHLSGGVSVASSTGDTVTCDELDFDGLANDRRGAITAAGNATLNHGDMAVKAKRVTVNF